MNFKRVSAAALATVLAASMLPAAMAADLPEDWTPADGARGPMLISPNPDSGDIALPTDGLLVEDGVYTEPRVCGTRGGRLRPARPNKYARGRSPCPQWRV